MSGPLPLASCFLLLVLSSDMSPYPHRLAALRLLWPDLQPLGTITTVSLPRLGSSCRSYMTPGTYPTGRPRVRINPFIAHPPSILHSFTYRILGFEDPRPLTHECSLTKVRFRLGGKFDSGFLQIPHWPLRHHVSTVVGPRFGFFGHPCLYLHIPSYRGYEWTFTI